MVRRATLVWTLAIVVCGHAVASTEEPARLPSEPTRLSSPLHCPVDGVIVGDRHYGVIWKGRRYFMDSNACVEAFMQDPEKFARNVEPRAALVSAPLPDRASYGPLFLYISLFIVTGLVTGGVTSYVGIQKGLGGLHWFAMGFFLNILAVAMVLHCRGRDMRFYKKGLRKTPHTYDPVRCVCSASNHPSAHRCSACGRDLQPTASSDVERVG